MKQLSLFNPKQLESEPSVDESLNMLFDDNILIDKNIQHCPLYPILQETPIISPNRYFRSKKGQVYRISFVGKKGCQMGRRVNFHNKYENGSRTLQEEYKRFYVEIYEDGERILLPFDEFDVIETHENIIDCLYPMDVIKIYHNGKIRFIKVLDRIKPKKKDTILLCELGKNKIIVHNSDIICKINPDWIHAKNLEKGNRIRHKYYGWLTVENVLHRKVEVVRKGNRMLISEFEIVEVD